MDSSEWKDILNRFGLEKYREALSLQDVQALVGGSGPRKTHQLVFEYLIQILMLNSNVLISIFQNEPRYNITKYGRESRSFEFLLQEENLQMDDSNLIHPQDVQLSVYFVSTPFLRSLFVSKLFSCKLAFPLMIPVPNLQEAEIVLLGLKSIIIPAGANRSRQTSALTHPMPMVSFVRLSHDLPISKSQCINEIMSDGNVVHNTFYTRKCPRGHIKRKLSNGVVEGTVFLTADDSQLPCGEILMINVRGNINDLLSCQKQYIDILTDIYVLFMNTDDLGNDVFKRFCAPSKRDRIPKLVVILLPGKIDLHHAAENWKSQFGGSFPDNIVFILAHTLDGKPRSANDMTSEVTRKISNFLNGHKFFKSLKEKYDTKANNITSLRAKVDYELNLDLAHVYTKFLTFETKLSKSHSTKKSLFPVYNIWQDDQNKHRDSCENGQSWRMISYGDETARKSLRLNQIKALAKQKCSGTDYFITTMRIHTPADNKRWQHYLLFVDLVHDVFDNMSRKYLPRLNYKYNELTAKLRKESTTGTRSPETLKSLKQTEYELQERSLSISHMFREVAQIYEAKEFLSKTVNKKPDWHHRYPKFAARLLLSGFPLELIDGDIGSIPMVWIKAVLKSLNELIKDAKILVLSVLGVQSSGKSTLLNAMFGVQFAVSAGRCTRGVNMQLVKVGKWDEKNNFYFDYILILDSEGIRAIESYRDGIKRDNEIATLVIGLSDLTIMNIKGEQYTDVQDVLQIAVHAFLRMHVQNYQSRCVFVHQNVPAVDAGDKLLLMKARLVASLNEATANIANLENRYSITEFKQIVQFDPEKHLYYFGDIKLGNHPMAPTNPNYFEKVVCLKRDILLRFQGVRDVKTAQEVSEHIESLWDGIVSQNFVFQFRNCDEIENYTLVEDEIRTHYIRLNTFVNTVCFNESVETFRRCISELELENSSKILIDTFSNQIKTLGARQEHTLIDFKRNQSTFPWHRMRAHGETPMQSEIDTILHRVETKVNILKNKRKREIITTISPNLRAKFDESIASMLNQKYDFSDESVVKKAFQSIWSQCVNVDSQHLPVATINIIDEVVDHLIKYFPLHRDKVRECIGRYDIRKPLTSLNEVQELIKIDCDTYPKYLIHITTDTPAQDLIDCFRSASLSSRSLLTKLEPIIEEIKLDERFSESRVSEIFKECRAFLVNHNRTHIGYEFTREFEFTVDILVLRLVIPIFRNIESKFELKNASKSHENNCYQIMYQMFTDMLARPTANDAVFGDFKDKLQRTMSLNVKEQIWTGIMDMILSQFTEKSKLLNIMHTEFMEKRCPMSQYLRFLRGTTRLKQECFHAVFRWIDTNIFCELTLSKELWVSIEANLEQQILDLGKCFRIDPGSCQPTTKQYIQNIMGHLEQRNLVLEYSLIPTNIKEISNAFEASLKSVHRALLDEIREIAIVNFEANYKELIIQLDHIWGCDKRCPICNEPCVRYAEHLTVDLKPHWCPVHRPTALVPNSKRQEYAKKSSHFSYEEKLWCTDELKKFKTFANWRFGSEKELDDYWNWFLSHNYTDLKGLIDDNLVSQIQSEYGSISVTSAQARDALEKRSIAHMPSTIEQSSDLSKAN